jgi:hypothetical protein
MIVDEELKGIIFKAAVVYFNEYNRDSRIDRGKPRTTFEGITGV